MTDPETEAVDELEDTEQAELEAIQQHLGADTFETPPFDEDGNPIWETF